jgi:hypothetical protein
MLTMKMPKYFSSHWVRRGAQICAIFSLSFLVSCTKEETPPPQTEQSKPSLVDQYKDTSKATAESPGLAGSPGQMAEEEKKEAGH